MNFLQKQCSDWGICYSERLVQGSDGMLKYRTEEIVVSLRLSTLFMSDGSSALLSPFMSIGWVSMTSGGWLLPCSLRATDSSWHSALDSLF